MPEQYSIERINRSDVQELLNRVSIQPTEEFSNRFPDEMPCRLTITLRDRRVLIKENHDYPGFGTQPMSWEMALEKFERIAGALTASSSRRSIANAVKNLESINVRDLTGLLSDLKETPNEAQRASAWKEW